MSTAQQSTETVTTAHYAIIHYHRPAGDYGDHHSSDFNNYWGLHVWGDGIEPAEETDWLSPKPFLGENGYSRFVWVRMIDPGQDINFILHKGNLKDGLQTDRRFNPATDGPEIWLKAGDEHIYPSLADAQGFVTIHYQRRDGRYDNGGHDYWGLHLWSDQGHNAINPDDETSWDAPRRPDGVDDYGAFWRVPLNAADALSASKPLKFIIHKPGGGNTEPGGDCEPGGDREFTPTETASVWLREQEPQLYRQRGAAEKFVRIHYHRPDRDYGNPGSSNFNQFWALQPWDGAAQPRHNWQEPLRWGEMDSFGPVFRVELASGASELKYVIHRGDLRDGTDNYQTLALDKWGHEVWQLAGPGPSPDRPHYVLPMLGRGAGGRGNLNRRRAHWLAADTIAWEMPGGAANTYFLHYAPEGGLRLQNGTVLGGSVLPLFYDPGGLPHHLRAKFRHLANLTALKLRPADLPLVPDILRGQIAVSTNAEDFLVDATGLQIPGALDDLYHYEGPLGIVFEGAKPHLYLWAPTARAVTLHLFDDARPETPGVAHPMTLDPASGVWSIAGRPDWKNKFYLYEVELYVHTTGRIERNLVTDPYSVSLSANSARSQLIDLNDPALTPAGWEALDKPPLDAPEDITLYELHVRDFSWSDPAVPEPLRGTFKAFTQSDSYSMRHLAALAEAGLSHVHLLPVFDIATIEERRERQQTPRGDLASFPPDSDRQQAAVAAVADADGFNWGYDPWHYAAPEGSYSTNPDGSTRVVEFREMVLALNRIGLRLIMDVVYNHTNAAGQSPKSVLDRIVPGYYHRLNADGLVETSTCCPNVATEHAMAEKLMIDTLLIWARHYKIDGFRFDLMGHHSKQNILKVREALHALTPERDGVDGRKLYLYGEGWNFGEVAFNARFDQATQDNLRGAGVGTFNDRFRDCIRGGSSFDGGQALVKRQGFINGLFYAPNAANYGHDDERWALLSFADRIRVGLAGGLADYGFDTCYGYWLRGHQIDHNGSPTGYTADPAENILYISAHDNQTLFDISQYKHPHYVSMAERVRAQNMGVALTMLAQGIPFFHAGVEMLRSKSLDRDSYNAGDWFNKLDFTYQTNNWGVGLPLAEANRPNWPQMRPLLANPALKPGPEDIKAAVFHMREMLAIRKSSRLFRLRTADEIHHRLRFHNTGPHQIPGLIVMSLNDEIGRDIDAHYRRIVVLFNASTHAHVFTLWDVQGRWLTLHPVQQQSADPVVKRAHYDQHGGAFSIPPRTTAVFVEPR